MISYRNVTKKYGAITAVDNFSLTIERGEFFALLGPNGAGKTTLLRMTTTLASPTSGSISISGDTVHRNLTRAKQRLGVAAQYPNLEAELSAWQNLEYHGRLYNIPAPTRKRRAAELLEFAGLTERMNDKAKTFSGGMQRKLMIVRALMHEPEILLLDEPTAGLDAAWRRRIWDLLRELQKQGLTIFFTTHYMEEAAALCSRLGVIDRGILIRTGTPREIIARAGNFVLEYFENGKTVQRFFDSREEALRGAARRAGDYGIRETNLEDAFITLTQKPPANGTYDDTV
ncbi:MAG: ABC transporter ATP-binding protein [Spirochaetaceae bacterium]|jgi:ABC-2 type transport system ATP-binding protein|nr:ABC transporter ATP-binding protein [Spirochaetaceae bacterium]